MSPTFDNNEEQSVEVVKQTVVKKEGEENYDQELSFVRVRQSLLDMDAAIRTLHFNLIAGGGDDGNNKLKIVRIIYYNN